MSPRRKSPGEKTKKENPEQTIQLRVYDQAIELYRECKTAIVPGYLKLQLLRASSSVALHIAEGYGKPTTKDRARRAIIDLEPERLSHFEAKADRLAAGLYKLVH